MTPQLKKFATVFVTIALPMLAFFGVSEVSIPVAMAEDVQALDNKIDAMRLTDEQLKLRDLELQKQQLMNTREVYDSNLIDTEQNIIEYESQHSEVPNSMLRRKSRYEQYILDADRLIERLDDRIQLQEQRLQTIEDEKLQ